MEDHSVHLWEISGGEQSHCRLTIDALPDTVLLDIFEIYRGTPPREFSSDFSWPWDKLTRVCRRWRAIIFASPRRLNLRIVCTDRTPTWMLHDIWPSSLPIAIQYFHPGVSWDRGEENIAAALKCHDRVCSITLFNVTGSYLERCGTLLQQPFPYLRYLRLLSSDKTMAVLPEEFLGGSAPSLSSLVLVGIAFPTLHLLSASRLDDLHILDIPEIGYISPGVMVSWLAKLPNLKCLTLSFRSPRSHPDQRNPPPPTRSVLPTLTYLRFNGNGEYLEDFAARVNTPLLDNVNITFFMNLIFNIPQFYRFITLPNRLQLSNRPQIVFGESEISIDFGHPSLKLEINCGGLDRQLSSMAEVCSQVSSLLSCVEQLEMVSTSLTLQNHVDSTLWLELLHPFATVQTLCVEEKLVPLVATALQDLPSDRTTEVLPALRHLFLEGLEPSGSLWEMIQRFVATRQLSDQPVAIRRWER